MKTFENQEKLPRLPIPPLENTLRVYLKSIKPHLPPSEHRKYSGICRDFQQKLGPILQSRLVSYEKTQKNSWLEEWWINLAYLSWRTSVLVHSNWYMVLKDLPNAPKHLPFTEGISEIQIKRAAGYASNLLNLKDAIENQELPAESTKQGPIDMNQYRRVFGITRVPKPNADILVGEFPAKGQHILVHIRDQIFTVPVYDNSGKRLRISDLESLFRECLAQSIKNVRQVPIGILTAQDRDPWAKDYAYLEKLDFKNRESFSQIQSALFSVCLDHRLMLPDISSMAKNVFHGFDGHNRWFDKSISVIVTNDGRLGINGEHSPCDALVPALILDNACSNEPARDPPNAATNPSIAPIQHLQFVADSVIKESLCNAQVFINQTIADSDVKVVPLSSYGSNFIKQVGKVSPDAYMQMALQLTFYRIHGYCAAVYETSSTRKFLHGRTETCRSLTPEQQEFVENFDRPISNRTRYRLFGHACEAHISYIQAASQGMGCDRHLLGLRMVMEKGESHEIFNHPVFSKSSKWQLSTSALFSSERIMGTGFGAVYHDGYGINYIITPELIKIGVESKKSDPGTSTDHFCKELEAVLEDLKGMCAEVNARKPRL